MRKQEDRIIRLSDYNISPEHGFLPDTDPLSHLPHSAIFSPLEALAYNLPTLLAAGVLRKELDILSRDLLCPVAKHAFDITYAYTAHQPAVSRRLKCVMDYLGQSYVWGQLPVAQQLPPGFAEFWHDVSDANDMPPVLTYAPYVLWNWQRLDPYKPITLDNIKVIQNFLGGLDENWFVMIHVVIEEQAGVIPGCIARALESVSYQDVQLLTHQLGMITDSLRHMLKILERMTEHCDPYIYYTRVRPYLHGSKNNPALPNGLLYPGVRAYHNEPQQFRGESGAQSAIVPSLVAALDIRHKESAFTPYLEEIRRYMPNRHRAFVQKIEHLSHNGFSIFDFVTSVKESRPDLYDIYRSCRRALHAFRQKHYQYVGLYIHSQAQQHEGNPTEVGTAGTPFMTSLKELMEETWFE